jgi:hypothetical protein
MLLLFAAVAHSIFIPYSRTAQHALLPMPNDFRGLLPPTTANLICLLLPPDSPEAAASRLAALAVIFSGLADFGFSRGTRSTPELAFCHRGVLVACSQFPASDGDVAHQILDWVDPALDPLDSADALYGRLGGTPLTLIVRAPEVGPALLWPILREIELCSIARVKSEVLDEMGFEKGCHFMYRRADRTMVAIENTTSAIEKASHAYFGKLELSAFSSERIICIYFDEMYNEMVHSLMYPVAEQFSEIRFGVVEREDFEMLDRLSLNLHTIPDTLIVRYAAGGYYPFEGMRGLAITDPEWANRVSQYASGVLNGSVSISYITENVDSSNEERSIMKLVGSTFAAFLADTNFDVVVLFYAALDSQSVPAEVDEAVKKVYRTGTTTIKFGTINVWRNACELEFPTLMSNPQLELFPATNRSTSIPYLGPMETNSLLHFFKDRASLPHKIELPAMSLAEATARKADLEALARELPERAARYAREDIQSLEALINSTSAGPPS